MNDRLEPSTNRIVEGLCAADAPAVPSRRGRVYKSEPPKLQVTLNQHRPQEPLGDGRHTAYEGCSSFPTCPVGLIATAPLYYQASLALVLGVAQTSAPRRR